MNTQQTFRLNHDILGVKLRRHQESVSGVTLSIDKGNLHGGIYILVEGFPAMYVSKTEGEEQTRLKFSGPQELMVFREKPIAGSFPDIYQHLNQNEPVTKEILETLSVLRGGRGGR